MDEFIGHILKRGLIALLLCLYINDEGMKNHNHMRKRKLLHSIQIYWVFLNSPMNWVI